MRAICLHNLRELSIVERQRAHELNIVMTELERAPCSLSDNCKCLLQEIIFGLAPRQTFTELGSLGGKLII